MPDEDNEQSPFSRPGFIAAAGVVAALVVAGVIVGVIVATQDDEVDPVPSPDSTSTAVPTVEPPADAQSASVCGLGGEQLDGTVTVAPEAEWAYEGTVAYPTSTEFGPVETNETGGFKYCFQRSPEGAVHAAAYALAVATDRTKVADWIEYFAAPGTYRDELLAEGVGGSDDTTDASSRLRLVGFRLLAYDGRTARVDLGVVVSSQGQNLNASLIYNLVWSEGDWKIDTSTPAPADFSSIPDFGGYARWSE